MKECGQEKGCLALGGRGYRVSRYVSLIIFSSSSLTAQIAELQVNGNKLPQLLLLLCQQKPYG
jgi:hypothetical protein